VADIDFMGTSFPIQTLIYYTSNNQLDSINLKNTLSGEVEEQVRTTNNSNGLVEKFYVYERDANNAWSLYDEYHLSANTFFSLNEKSVLNLNVFPNPSKGNLNLNNPLPAELSIRNLSGELVWEQKDLAIHSQVDLSVLAQGLYLLQIKLSDNSIASGKLIIE